MEALFTASEMVLVSADRHKLTERARGGDRGAALALDLLSKPERALATTLTATNAFVVLSSVVVPPRAPAGGGGRGGGGAVSAPVGGDPADAGACDPGGAYAAAAGKPGGRVGRRAPRAGDGAACVPFRREEGDGCVPPPRAGGGAAGTRRCCPIEAGIRDTPCTASGSTIWSGTSTCWTSRGSSRTPP